VPTLAALIEVDQETGAVSWFPADFVLPVLLAAASAITAALLFYLLVISLPMILRIVWKIEVAALLNRLKNHDRSARDRTH
jgi:hypothetical protein